MAISPRDDIMLHQRLPSDSDPLRIEHRNERPDQIGRMSAQVDVATGTIRATGTGTFSPTQVRAYFRDLGAAIGRIHDAGRSVSALIDLRGSAAQPPEMVALIDEATRTLYRGNDRVAMVVPTSVMKLGLRRALDARCHDFFLSLTAAQTWLSAWAR